MSSSATPAHRVPRFLTGTSLYPHDSDSDSSVGWYERDPDSDLAKLARAGCSLVRVFVSWRALEPQVGQYSQEMLARLSAIMTSVRSRKMQAIVCLFADDRQSGLSSVAWGTKRDLHTDQYLLQRAAEVAGLVARHLAQDSRVVGWQLGNEAFLTGFESFEALSEWFDAVRDAVRSVDPVRPVGLGADAETLYQACGIDARAVVERGDLRFSHSTAAYRSYAADGPLTVGPATYLDSYLLRVAHQGTPVIADEIGPLSQGYSVAEEAAHIRTALWSAFANRAAAAMVRRMRDVDTDRREPYFVDPYETLVGIADEQGLAKPAFLEVSEFVKTLARIDLGTYTPMSERAAILVPHERYDPLPSLAGLYGPRACFQSYITAKRAHVPVTVVHENDDFSAHLVLVVPSAMQLADETWERLAEFVQGGGTLLMSYGGGDAHPAIRRLFGVEPLGDGGPRDALTCRIAQPEAFGALRSFDARLLVPSFALLGSGGATVIATDDMGSPLLTVNRLGQGRAVYVAVPLERAIAQDDPLTTSAEVAYFATEVYGAVARSAGCRLPVTCDCPDIEVALFQGGGDDVLVLINHADKPVSARFVADRAVASVTPVRAGETMVVGSRRFELELGASGVAVVRLDYA